MIYVLLHDSTQMCPLKVKKACVLHINLIYSSSAKLLNMYLEIVLVDGSLTVTVAENSYGLAWGK